MLALGENIVEDVKVLLVRKRVRCINLRVRRDGSVAMSIPLWRGTIAEASAFLESKWEWVLRTRERVLSAAEQPSSEVTQDDIVRLSAMLEFLTSSWAARFGEEGVTWKLRRMRTRWGVCHYAKRRITYAIMLALQPRELVEYVVVHELTHLRVHNHGPAFQALMTARMPDWRARRRRLSAHRQ